jgi:DNA-binding response OmpR family regulator
MACGDPGLNVVQNNAEPPLALVVEDSVLVAMAIEDALTERGFAVEVATTLVSAQRLLARRQPVAALLDLHLPDGNTLDLAMLLHDAGCAVAISSAYDSDAIPDAHSFAAQFRKPVSPDILAEWAVLVADPLRE